MAMPQVQPVSVRMFGPLTIAGPADGTLSGRGLGGPQMRRVLALLLLERGRAVAKDRLADLLWDQQPPPHAVAGLESHVSGLRRHLDAWAPGVGRRVIATATGGYVVPTSAVDVDVDRFTAQLRQAAEATDPGSRRAHLESALTLATADLLADEPYASWVQADRTHLGIRRTQALVDLAETCLALDDSEGAATAAAQALTADPTLERAARIAMTSFARLGELAAVHRTYEQLRQALAELVGVAPSDATERHRVALLSATQSHLLQTAGPDDVSDPAPSIEYADNRGVRIAYQVVGGGPVDLAFIPSFVTNLATTWEDPTYAEFLGALATRSRLLLFDKRGTGLSDPALDFPSAAERSEDLAAVLDAAGSGECVLFGVCAGAALAIQFAVDHPERTAGLVLFGGFARMLSCPGYPWGWPEQRYKQFLESFEDAWLHSGERISRRNPALVDNPRYRRWFERYLQVAASPYLARRLAEMNADLDVRDLLPRVAAPALVMVHADDVWMAAENSSYLAQHLPHARLVTLPGRDHDPWTEDTGPVLAELESFLNELSQGRIALNT